MIYVPLPHELLLEHKALAKEEGQLNKDLLNLKNNIVEGDEIAFAILNYVIDNLIRIVSCSIEELKIIQKEYFQLIHSLESYFNLNSNQPNLEEISKFENVNNAISKVFLKAYKNFTKRNSTEWNSYKFLKRLNQNVCPYCNANFIYTVQSNYYLSQASSRAMADLDHFLPKSIFPIFSITLSNLVPSCIYCNQRFKSSYYTSFSRNLSPYDININEKIRFKVSYKQYKSAYEKLKEIDNVEMSELEKYYIKLFSGLNYFKDIRNFVKNSKKDLDEISSTLQNLYNVRINNLKHRKQLRIIFNLSNNYRRKLDEFISSDIISIIESKEIFVSKLEMYLEKFNYEIQEYKLLKGKNNTQRSNVTKLNKLINDNFQKLKKIFDTVYKTEINETNEINYVDIFLGKSSNYQIEVIVEGTSDFERYILYNNAVLFQLEAVYNEYKGYINRKIEQSYILNNLYKSQLQKQFPNLFHEYSIEDMSNLILIDRENQNNEILGRLIFDLVVPNVKSQNHPSFPLLTN